MIQTLFFFFAAVAVGAAINVLAQKHVLYSALSLILMLSAVSVLFILLRADFLAVIQVIVYAGGIMVLIVFVIMLLNLPQDEDGVDRLRWLRALVPRGGQRRDVPLEQRLHLVHLERADDEEREVARIGEGGDVRLMHLVEFQARDVQTRMTSRLGARP